MTMPVVICFHFTTFAVLETARSVIETQGNSCDLLSFYYLCRTGNSKIGISTDFPKVVICFHFTTFAVLETAAKVNLFLEKSCDLLSFYYLCRTGNSAQLTKQIKELVVICFHFTTFAVLETANQKRDIASRGCDLLSFYYLCRTGNSDVEAFL